jgi:hypothetical protein
MAGPEDSVGYDNIEEGQRYQEIIYYQPSYMTVVTFKVAGLVFNSATYDFYLYTSIRVMYVFIWMCIAEGRAG